MRNILKKQLKLEIRAFTLLESLLCLFLLTGLLVLFSSSIQVTMRQTREALFYKDFEALYRDSQVLAIQSNQLVDLKVGGREISNGVETVSIPDSIQSVQSYHIRFDPSNGGNSSLQKIVFQGEEKQVVYQLYLGSGRYKKTEG